ncbi:hypothetical protein DNL40_07150 [Xylanimonas oleitrophica]|uniref:ScoMcrA-like N-terminal head domain-containing protein n=1 Tax=Xylanimonas oleitrophica TaxID=2607479 RepID=A0A2W5YGK3_9MICO|nr:hypothetical protein [Xylanimonas oleitrophica]PZR53871.1 hypothetical protein DNL40_07150 [Xylanimonas oleitrophica]
MATFSSVTRQHVLQAIAEHDDRGAESFLGVYGFAPSGHTVRHEGSTYDSRAILGVAHRYATGRAATAQEVDNSPLGADVLLSKRGFEVSGPATAAAKGAAKAPARRRTPSTTAAPRRQAVPERVEVICPTCAMTLPATGICDDCG